MPNKVFPIEAKSLEAAIDPNNKLTFLLDWELTFKCNLDCGYCSTDLYGGHDNNIPHPPLDECLKTIDFMYEYVDSYMKYKKSPFRHVILNVYGGESLFHPDIVTILEQVKEKHVAYRDRWTLTVTVTTNAVVSSKQMTRVVDLVDEFTVSYHTENTDKQKQLVRDNLLLIKNKGRRLKCIILMHTKDENFADDLKMIEFCQTNQIKYLPRQLDHHPDHTQWNYKPYQVVWFDDFYKQKSFKNSNQANLDPGKENTDLAEVGRACCGGRQLSHNQNYQERAFYVHNKFPDWYCSVNWFFVYVKQVTKEVFVNKDCKMNFNGEVGPIGLLDKTEEILADLQNRLDNSTLPVIQCKKRRCYCGLCAPKAKDSEQFNLIMKKYKL